jgi:predicted nucleic acid-binding protein
VKWLLDTNVLSEPFRPRPDRAVLDWLASRAADETVISIVAVAELRVGARAVADKTRRDDITRWIDEEISRSFADRILPLSTNVLVDWIEIGRALAARGETRAPADLLVASTARIHDLIIVTRNARDFARTGTIVYDPWSGETHRMDRA